MNWLFFFWFILWFPKNYIFDHKKTDAIVVFTGGTDRIKEGFFLLKNGYAKKLLISGVHKSVKIDDLKVSSDFRSSIDLGYKANHTKGNAIETCNWIKNNGYQSVRLVTDKYHMKRSEIELKKICSNISILTYPVERKTSLLYIFKEFNKYIKSIFF